MERRANELTRSMQENNRHYNKNLASKLCKETSKSVKSMEKNEKIIRPNDLRAFAVGVLKAVNWKDRRWCLELRI